MRGLIMKDMLTIAKQAKAFLILILFFAVIPSFSGSSFAMLYAAMMPISALAYDENCKWDQLAAMMPYSVRTGALSIASLYVTAAAKGTAVSGEDIAQIAVVACFALIFLAVNLPCMFRLGVEKGRLLFMAMIGVIVFFIMGFGDKIADGINKASAGGNLAPGAVAIAALALAANMASVALSGRAYKKKMRSRHNKHKSGRINTRSQSIKKVAERHFFDTLSGQAGRWAYSALFRDSIISIPFIFTWAITFTIAENITVSAAEKA